MLVKPFGEVFKPQRPTEDMWYIGNVENNNDPLKLRRLQIRTIVHEDLATEDLPWASPIPTCFLGSSPNSEDFAVPEIGSQVRVFFPTYDQNTPFYMGGETNEFNKCTFFDEDYPNCYGRKDSIGNFLKVNKVKKTIHAQHCSGANVQIDDKGGVTATTPNGSQLRVEPNGEIIWQQGSDGQTLQFQFNADGSVYLKCNSVKIQATAFSVDTPKADFMGDLHCARGASAEVQAGPVMLGFDGGILKYVK